MIDSATGGTFMAHTFRFVTLIHERSAKISIAWHTRDFEVEINTHTMGMSVEQHYKKTRMDLLTKHLLISFVEKV